MKNKINNLFKTINMETAKQFLHRRLNEKRNQKKGFISASTDDVAKIMEEYAKLKWEKACQLQIKSCLNNLRTPFSDSLAYGDVSSAPKPKFT